MRQWGFDSPRLHHLKPTGPLSGGPVVFGGSCGMRVCYALWGNELREQTRVRAGRRGRDGDVVLAPKNPLLLSRSRISRDFVQVVPSLEGACGEAVREPAVSKSMFSMW